MVEGILHRFTNGALDLRHECFVEITAGANAGQRHRQCGLVFPPLAKISHAQESVVGVREAAFVNDEARIDFTA